MTSESPPQRLYPLDPDEKVTTVMAYTADALIWGDVVTKQTIRASTWLRTQAVPQYIKFHDANVLKFGSGANPRPWRYNELYLPSALVIAFHLRPPNSDALDYDPNEAMRKMEPAAALVGWFRFDGFMRMSTQTDLTRYLEVSKEVFTSMYDVTISQLASQGMSAIHTPFVLLRGANVLFAKREE